MVVPGTGIHLNNVMGEEDLNPLGFHTPSGGAADAEHDGPVDRCCAIGEVELVLGSAGSNRIRSAILQTIVGVVDHGLRVPAAVSAPRAHFEGGIVYHEPGIEPALDPSAGSGRRAQRRARGRALPRPQSVLRRGAGGAAIAGRS